MSYSEKIKELRDKHNLSQSELAEKLDLSRVTINKYVKELINDKYISIEKDHLSKFKILKKTEKIVEILITLKNCMIEWGGDTYVRI